VIDPSEAETVEELAEIGVAFLELDLQGERNSLLHGDEQHPRVVIQAFSGFTLGELDLFDWIQWTWDVQLRRPGSCLLLEPSEFKGRYALLAGLFNTSGAYLGFMHADRKRPFSSQEQARLARFAEGYGRHLGSLVESEAPPEEVELKSPKAIVFEQLEPSEPVSGSAPPDSGAFHWEWAWMDYI